MFSLKTKDFVYVIWFGEVEDKVNYMFYLLIWSFQGYTF